MTERSSACLPANKLRTLLFRRVTGKAGFDAFKGKECHRSEAFDYSAYYQGSMRENWQKARAPRSSSEQEWW